jgi:hypothetical protein
MEKNILIQYIIWQFIESPKELLKIWKNFLIFNINYFSIPFLLRTLFSYWHKYSMSYGKGLDPGRWFEAFVFNVIMSRLIGAIVRISFIIIGISIELLILVIGAVLFLLYLFLPFILVFLFMYGFALILF